MNNPDFLALVDNQKQPIEAHGGCILYHEETYYWYGEDRRNDSYVRVYRSKTLKDWENCGAVISISTPIERRFDYMEQILVHPDGSKVNLERPKVIFNQAAGLFVMYMHYENGFNYDVAAVAVAVSHHPDHGFIYLGHYRPLTHMSRDLTLFVDDDHQAYLISASNNNFDLHVYRLNDDYLQIKELVTILFPGLSREAPALVKHRGFYYLFTSGCTGWKPNQCQFAYASSIDGSWTGLIDIGDEVTFHSQPAFILTYRDKPYYVGDVWGDRKSVV